MRRLARTRFRTTPSGPPRPADPRITALNPAVGIRFRQSMAEQGADPGCRDVEPCTALRAHGMAMGEAMCPPLAGARVERWERMDVRAVRRDDAFPSGRLWFPSARVRRVPARRVRLPDVHPPDETLSMVAATSGSPELPAVMSRSDSGPLPPQPDGADSSEGKGPESLLRRSVGLQHYRVPG